MKMVIPNELEITQDDDPRDKSADVHTNSKTKADEGIENNNSQLISI